MKSSDSKVLTDRFFNRSFASTIGLRPENLYQTPLDLGIVETFSPPALNNGEGVQVIAALHYQIVVRADA